MVLVIAYSLSALSFALPKDVFPLHPFIEPVTKVPMTALNLWQYWDMFAPTPRTDDIRLEIIYQTPDGGEHSVFITDMMAMNYFERWQKERWRKYFNDNLRTDAKKYLWAPFASYFYQDLKRSGIEVVEITLVRHWRTAQKPVSPQLRADQNPVPWNSYRFYVWRPQKPGVSPSFGG